MEQAAEMERKLRRNEFDLEDFLGQLKAIRRMGPLSSLLGMIPGLGAGQLRGLKLDERELDRIEAIILSMTPEERRRPELIKGSRRLRIARGLGHPRAAGQQPCQAVRPDAQGDAPGRPRTNPRRRRPPSPGPLSG